MGMSQRRCPLCKKLRPWEEGYSGSPDKLKENPNTTDPSLKRHRVWDFVDGKKVCGWCVERNGAA